MQLAIDTSTDTASLALVQDGEILTELTWRCGRNHTIQLLPNLSYLLKQLKSNLQAVDGVVVARGPVATMAYGWALAQLKDWLSAWAYR